MTASPTILLIRATQDSLQYYVFYTNRRGNKQALHFSKHFSQSNPAFWISWSLSEYVFIYITAHLCQVTDL